MRQPPPRLASIDVFRAVTMLLMIFVNDLWTLKDIPAWLEHTKANDDGMGLADTIFPAFLFIVGLAIPFAIQNRQAKGKSKLSTGVHIVYRTIALLLIGVFHVNFESYSDTALISKPVFEILCTIGFFLTWLDYPPSLSKTTRMILQVCGIALLALMAVFYQGKDGGNIVWMKTHWWGILGLIGWCYLLAAGIYLLTNGRLILLIAAFLFFLLFNLAHFEGWLKFMSNVRPYVWIVSNGSLPAMTMAGVVTAIIYTRTAKGNFRLGWLLLLGFAVIMFIYGFMTRPLEGISKIKATPSWTAICTGINIVCFMLFAILVDLKGKKSWFNIIKPGGTSTLTAYLLPYIHYSLIALIGFSLPLFLRTGAIGILKSLLYALVIILITGVLEKSRIRLKI